MSEEKKNISCPKCDADIAVADITDGRCPKCGFNIQRYIDENELEAVRKKEAEKVKKEEKPPVPEKKRGLSGFGL